MKSKTVPKKLHAVIVNGEFDRLRVFRNGGTAMTHKIRMVEMWRGKDESRAKEWRSAKIVPYRGY